jgi:4'-phosphopantetheinyl transferase
VTGVDVWLVNAEISVDDEASFASVLDDHELARARSGHTAADRRRYVVAHGAARMILGARLGIAPDRLTWARGRHGKPTLVGLDVHVNLSHSGEFTAIAMASGRPVGIDIQTVMPSLDTVAMAWRFFAPAEAAEVAGAGTASADLFARLWARKEAVIKAAGGRLMRGLGIVVCGGESVTVDFPYEPAPGAYRVADVAAPAGYRAAVALAGVERYQVRVRPVRSAAEAAAA